MRFIERSCKNDIWYAQGERYKQKFSFGESTLYDFDEICLLQSGFVTLLNPRRLYDSAFYSQSLNLYQSCPSELTKVRAYFDIRILLQWCVPDMNFLLLKKRHRVLLFVTLILVFLLQACCFSEFLCDKTIEAFFSEMLKTELEFWREYNSCFRSTRRN